MIPTAVPGFYNLRAVSLKVGNFVISDLGDGGVQFEIPSDLTASSVSADGRTHFHVIHDDRMTVTISVMAASAAAKALYSLYLTQARSWREGGTTPGLLFDMFDPILGDSVSESFAVFQSIPTPNKDVEEGTRDFVLLLPNAKASLMLAANQGSLPAIPSPGAATPLL